MANEKDSIHARFEAGQDVMQVCKETGMTLEEAGWRYCVWINEGGRKQAPVLDAGLVERMMSEHIKHSSRHPSIHEQHRIGMTAALRVAADALLGPVTDEEAKTYRPLSGLAFANWLLAARRARLLAPARSAEDRARKFYSSPAGWCVVVDENRDHPLTAYKMEGKVADAYYAHVIATLKQEGK